MTYDKKDLPKIIVLSVILLAMVIYIGVRYAGLSAKFKAAQEAERQAHMQARAQAPPPSATSPVRPSIAAHLAPVPPPTHDPFEPIIAPRRQRAAAPRPAPTTRQDTDEPEPAPLLPMLPPIGGQASSSTSSQVLSVTGIIMGEPNLAVLRQGEDHFIVRTGDELAGGMRVAAISRNTVTLRDRRRDYVLRLGG